MQEDHVCESLYPSHYSRATQICVGDPRKVKTGFKVSFPASKDTDLGAKIIGDHEAKPHSSPYMAYLQIQTEDKIFICEGFLVREDFVLTAAHCQGSLCSSINVTLGAHNIMDREKTQQVIPVRRAIPHPRYNDKTLANDIMLLQLNHHHPGGHNIKQQERTQQAFGWECKCGDSVVLTYPTAENMGTRGMLTPACGEHSSGSSINVTLGAHNIKQQERTQQVIGVKRAIRHPDYNPKNFSNDIMLLQARKTPHWPCPPGIRS
ncbi:hypothetical protein MJG53_012824 [Ovis ammon polii x Ovis aries]|uniref:Uncharacterized protein n=1 Tax=Ovis ammon polii x Ovis aries TaxID=2918886 RepID=A0ACB9UMN7_9CETA|nr:hypothetical protein MJG53_012824 [Ovis ammon polii x Ovis aries]